MVLNDETIRKLPFKAKKYCLSDGEGLKLAIKPSSSKTWSLNYARGLAKQARLVIAAGRDPIVDKEATEYERVWTFGELCEELMVNKVAKGNSEAALTKNRWYLFGHGASLMKTHKK